VDAGARGIGLAIYRGAGAVKTRTQKETSNPMKKAALLLSFVFAAGVAVAHEGTKADAAKAPASAETKATTATHTPTKVAMKTHKVEAEVVSTDAAAKTITIKSDTGENKTAPVEGKAIAELKTVKAGEKYTLTCRDNEAGEHQAVVAIAKMPAVKKTAVKK
jgi:hypothetical protein